MNSGSKTPNKDENDNNQLLHQSNNAARNVTVPWMRAALREVALHSIRQLVQVSQKRTDGNNDVVIETEPASWVLQLTQEDIAQVIRTCQVFAQAWGAELHAASHHQVAEWLGDMVNTESSTLFFKQDTTAANASLANINEKKKPPSQTVASAAASSNSFLALTKIQKLMELPSILDDNYTDDEGNLKEHMEHALAQLHAMGQQGATYWPFDWNTTIAPAAAQLASRLYPTKQDRPKSELLLEAEDSKPSATESAAALLHRKRKSSTGKPPARRRKKAAIEVSTNDTAAVAATPHARAPSDLEEERWTWLDIQQSMTLDQAANHLHNNSEPAKEDQKDETQEKDNDETGEGQDKESSSTTTIASGVLLGSLCDFGRLHCASQRAVDLRPSSPAASRMAQDVKKQVRFQRRMVKERLGGHELGWASDYGMPRKIRSDSKVTLTMSSPDVAQHKPQEHWLEADLAGGPVLLELTTTNNKKPSKTLHAFASVELMLLDEDSHNNNNTTSDRTLSRLENDNSAPEGGET